MECRRTTCTLGFLAVVSTVAGCARRTSTSSSELSLATLPVLIDSSAGQPPCKPAPASIHVELEAPGPYTFCGSGYLSILDRNGQTVLYTREWPPQSERAAAAARDSIAAVIAHAWGQPAICGNETREWFRSGTRVDLHIERTADVEHADSSWRVTLGGEVGRPACAKGAA